MAAVAIGTALAAPIQIPTIKPMPQYTVERQSATGRVNIVDLFLRPNEQFNFASTISNAYNNLVAQQVRLDHDIEAAIFSDIESLYED
ncbi:MAG: hypothetical protein LCH39_04030 [Proteobacteria bacterium]|nr:hypothetical protein [Pseudomonadota bacterium]